MSTSEDQAADVTSTADVVSTAPTAALVAPTITAAPSPDKRPYDFIVFGASGFTGQYVVEEVARTIGDEGQLKWAIAGRSMAKLQDILKQASQVTGQDLEELPIVIADVSDSKSLMEMCAKTRLVLNCVGPYSYYGEVVVKSCLATKTHHMDISGEPGFLEKMQLDYNQEAKDEGVFIIGACGFDSIPSELGVQFTKNNAKGHLVDVENFFEIIPGPDGMLGNFATWHSAVEGYGNVSKLMAIRKQLFPTKLPLPRPLKPKRGTIFKNKELNVYCLPFVGSDRSIVSRTMRYFFEDRQEPPFNFTMFTCFNSLVNVVTMVMMGMVFGIFSKFSCGRWILKTFPYLMSFGNFSKNGPTRKQIETTTFVMNMLADSQNEDASETYQTRVRVSGPEVGYATTPICLVQAAYSLLKEAGKLPEGGGVFTAGAAFEQTTLLNRLQNHNINFEVVKDE